MTAIQPGDWVTVDGHRRQVLAIEPDAWGELLILDCGEGAVMSLPAEQVEPA